MSCRVVTRFCLILTSILSLVSKEVQAGTFDLYGVSGRSMSMGSAMTAAVDDWAASYYNPAQLMEKSEFSFGFGFQLAAPNVKIAATNPGVETKIPETYYGFSLGLIYPFGGKLKNRVALGLIVYLPGQNLVRTRFQEPAVPHFYMFDSMPSRFQIIPSLAAKPVEWLRLGVGLQVLASLDGVGRFDLDIANGRFPRRELSVDLTLAVAPTAGISIKPIKGLTLAVAYRGELALPIKLVNTVNVQGLDAAVLLDINGITQWTPHTFQLGAAYQFEKPKITLAADLLFALWSRAPDPSVFLSLNIQGQDVDRLGLTGALDAPSVGNERRTNLALSNTLGFRLGAEWVATDWAELRLGYNYRPSPVPVQTTGTNVLDNDTHTITAGLGINFRDPLDIFSMPVSLDVGGFASFLPQRSHIKDSANDPVGDLSAGGQLFGFSVSLRYTFGADVAAPASSGEKAPTEILVPSASR